MEAAPTQARRRATAVSQDLGMGIGGVGGGAQCASGDAEGVRGLPLEGEFCAGVSLRRGDEGGGETRGFAAGGGEEGRGGSGGRSSPA